MLRWIVRGSRALLLFLGVVFLIWLPFTWLFPITVNGPAGLDVSGTRPDPETIAVGAASSFGGSIDRGAIVVWRLGPSLPSSGRVIVRHFRPRGEPFVPTYVADAYGERGWHVVTIPLWLLAAICLAWPVTSLLLARRRRKGRGFAVEPAADAAPPAIDPPPHHPSNLPPP